MSERILLGTTSTSASLGSVRAQRSTSVPPAANPLAALVSHLRGLARRLPGGRRPGARVLPLSRLPRPLLRDVDPALHDAMTGLYTGWNGLDAGFRSSHC